MNRLSTAVVVVASLVAPDTRAQAPEMGVRFDDVSEAAGIQFEHERAASWEKLYLETMGAGVGWIDYDQDGLLDAFFVNSGATPNFQPETPRSRRSTGIWATGPSSK